MNRHTTGMQSLSTLVDTITTPVFSRYRGYIEARLVTDWALIAGHKLSLYTVPRKVIFQDREHKTNGLLHVDVLNSAIALEVSYMIPVLLEKIAVYMGYKAITRIKTHLRPSPCADIDATPNAIAPLPPEKMRQLQDSVNAIDDTTLREALYRLGHYVMVAPITGKPSSPLDNTSTLTDSKSGDRG